VKTFFKRKLFTHAVFWLISFVVLHRLFTVDYNNGKTDVIYTIVFHVPLLIVVYLNYFFINKLINSKRYFLYLLAVFLLSAIGIGLHYLVFDHLVDLIFSGYYFISMYSLFEICQYIFAYIVVSLLFKLSKDWFDLKDQQLALQKESHKVQLTNLKAQLNPHFLFNSLNNIYSMTSTDVKKGREHIIKLSDALRYMLYKTNDERVLLENEIEYFSNYIELEKLRLEDEANIQVSLPSKVSDLKIAPLILLPFIENCFKHCDKEKPEIIISLELNNNQLKLICRNNKSDSSDSKVGGVGLTNAKKRLELIYPNKYQLNIEDKKEFYTTTLNLELL